MIRLVMADDHLLFRSMLEEMLKRDDEMEIVASYADGCAALEGCKTYRPDIALLDIGMPGKNGIEVLKEIKGCCPQIKVVILTTFENEEQMKLAIQNGADGYLIKDMKPETLIMSLKCVYNNMVLFHNSIHGILQSYVPENQNIKSHKVQVDDMVFDGVDIKIMQMIVQGKSNRDIGLALNYSEGTIKNKVSRMLALTGYSDRTELSVFAINQDLV